MGKINTTQIHDFYKKLMSGIKSQENYKGKEMWSFPNSEKWELDV